MAKLMSIKLEFVAPLPQIAITRFTYNTLEFNGPQDPRYKEVDLYAQTSWPTLMNINFCQTNNMHSGSGIAVKLS